MTRERARELLPNKELLDCFTFIDGTNCGKKVK